MKKESAVRFLSLMFIASLLSSCAFTKETIKMSYTPVAGVMPVPGASGIGVKVAVSDERADQTKVSSKKNGYGMETAPISSDRSVAEVFKSAVEAELQNRGFKLGTQKSVSVVIDRFYNDFKIGFWSGDSVGELEMVVSIGNYRRSIKTKQQHVVMVANGKNAQQALEMVLQDALNKLFADETFIAALKK